MKLIYVILLSIIIAVIIIIITVILKKLYLIDPDIKYTLKTRPILANDGNTYKVHNFGDSATAANILASINSILIKLLSYLKNKYSVQINNNYNENSKYDAVKKILMRYNPDNLIENSPNDNIDTSYTLNKGSMVAFCLRDKGSNNYIHDINTLTFVAIHELAHMAIEEDGHPPKFWSMFKWLLMEAEMGNIYFSKNYSISPIQYCGMTVNYNPRFDYDLN
jgi:hypothetical protein